MLIKTTTFQTELMRTKHLFASSTICTTPPLQAIHHNHHGSTRRFRKNNPLTKGGLAPRAACGETTADSNAKHSDTSWTMRIHVPEILINYSTTDNTLNNRGGRQRVHMLRVKEVRLRVLLQRLDSTPRQTLRSAQPRLYLVVQIAQLVHIGRSVVCLVLHH